jgi:hypothetical protein
MEQHTQIKSRQVHGSTSHGEGHVPAMETSGSCKATMYDEMKRGIKFDDDCHDIQKETPMAEEHTSRTR